MLGSLDGDDKEKVKIWVKWPPNLAAFDAAFHYVTFTSTLKGV
jgi:hypothetical protein